MGIFSSDKDKANAQATVNIPLYSKFTKREMINMAFYTGGIMCYKFVLEFMNGCMSNLILGRIAASTLPKGLAVSDVWTILQSISLIFQCIGCIVVAPLIRRWDTSKVLALSILSFAIVIALIPIIEASTGGTIPPANAKPITAPGASAPTLVQDQKQYFGAWNVLILFAIFPIAGIFHGIIELIRRVIPSDIVGGDSEKLKKMDATVHMWYEVAGTSGAFIAAYSMQRFGYAFTTMWIPIGFFLAFLLFRMINTNVLDATNFKIERAATTEETEVMVGNGATAATSVEEKKKTKRGICSEIWFFTKAFFHSVKVGAVLVFTNRSLIWLMPAYVLPLVVHRYFESTFFPFYSKYNLGDGSTQQIFVGGSNFGELLGAAAILFTATLVKTPLPWLRADAITLLLIFVYVYYEVPDTVAKFDAKSQLSYLAFANSTGATYFAWKLSALGAAVSFGW